MPTGGGHRRPTNLCFLQARPQNLSLGSNFSPGAKGEVVGMRLCFFESRQKQNKAKQKTEKATCFPMTKGEKIEK